VKKILTYKLFESNDQQLSQSVQKFLNKESPIDNEPEVESIVTDICQDFMDDYDLRIGFDWGWMIISGSSYVWHKDSTIDLCIDQSGGIPIDGEFRVGLEKTFFEIKKQGKRFLQVEFIKHPTESSKFFNI
jgi:hypothetical protein